MVQNAGNGGWAHLLETDGSSLLAEALAAEVKAVLADETSLVGAEAAVGTHYQHSPPISLAPLSVPLLPSIPQIFPFHSLIPNKRQKEGRCSPLTAALAELAGAREPNGVVGHFGWS